MRFGCCAGLVWTLLVGCGNVEIRPDSQSGGDHERAGAKQLVLSKLTDDHVDASQGDNTDWKYFKITQKGILELTVYWDNRDVDASIDVRDRFGVLIDSRRHSAELEKDQLDIKVNPGTHFLRIGSEKGASVYTVEAVFQRFDHSPKDDVIPEAVPLDGDFFGEPRPDPIPMDTPRRPGRRRARKPTARRTPQPAPRAKGRAIKGTIVRIIPTKNKRTYLTLNIGSKHGVSQNARGVIVEPDGSPLPGGKLKVTQVKAKSSQALTSLTKEQIAHRRLVHIYVK